MSASRMYRSLPALMLSLLLVSACGGGDDAATGGDAAASDAYVVPAGEAASIAGTVAFQGTPPAPESIDMADEPTCEAKHGSAGPTTEAVVVNDNSTLANVFVYVKEGLGDRTFAAGTGAKVIDQDGCTYRPHVIGVQTDQPLTFRNSDGLLHNINAQATTNRSFNISQPQNMDSQRSFTQPEIMIPVRCDVHGWMEAYIGVVDHPYFAVTGEDGSFTIENLPPGDYTLEAWHERYGTQTMQVSVAAQETGEASFTFNEGMAASAVVPLGAPIDPHGSHTPVAAVAAAAGR
ncbi:MAG: carboxypeptidase regulatory-like domain-containing protein [Gemmatimonadota bacterium]